jgi:hypothetical protein
MGMLIGWSPAVSYGEIAGPADTVQQFFMASKTGDLKTMKNLMTGPFLNRRKALIEKNPGYSDFLKKQLGGVEIAIISTTIENNGSSASVTVRRLYPDGSTFDTEFSLDKGVSGTWKIFDERRVQ